MDPSLFDIEDVEENKEISSRHVLFEIDLIERLGNIGHGPKLLDHARYNQTENHPCPGGTIYVIAMERIPGENVEDIEEDLSKTQLLSIRKQLAYILEEMRKMHRVMDVEDSSFLQYDKKKDKL